eukprot:jgi/Chlat1/7349/Chrsp59S06959
MAAVAAAVGAAGWVGASVVGGACSLLRGVGVAAAPLRLESRAGRFARSVELPTLRRRRGAAGVPLEVRADKLPDDVPIPRRNPEVRPKKRKDSSSPDHDKEQHEKDHPQPKLKLRLPKGQEWLHAFAILGTGVWALSLLVLPGAVLEFLLPEVIPITDSMILLTRAFGASVLAVFAFTIAIFKMPTTYKSTKIAYAGMASMGAACASVWGYAYYAKAVTALALLLVFSGLYAVGLYGGLLVHHT